MGNLNFLKSLLYTDIYKEGNDTSLAVQGASWQIKENRFPLVKHWSKNLENKYPSNPTGKSLICTLREQLALRILLYTQRKYQLDYLQSTVARRETRKNINSSRKKIQNPKNGW